MRISIITSTYNRKDYLVQMIESVQKSIFAPCTDVEWEHIIYDDGSTDGTSALFENHTWKNTKYIRSEENKGGPSHGRNIALKQATGDYIFMIDHDDILLQRTLYNFIVWAKKFPEVPWFIGDFLRVDEHLSYIIGNDYYGWDFESPREMLEAIFKGEHFIQSSVFFKKALFTEAGDFDVTRPVDQDLDLFIRFLLNNHLPIHCPFTTHLHRMHNTNLSGDITQNEHMKNMAELKVKYGKQLKEKNIDA